MKTEEEEVETVRGGGGEGGDGNGEEKGEEEGGGENGEKVEMVQRRSRKQ